MKLKYSFECIDMGSEFIAVPVGKGAKEIQGVLKLNREGAEIITLLANDMTEKAIVQALRVRYKTSEGILTDYVHNTIEKLTAIGLIER